MYLICCKKFQVFIQCNIFFKQYIFFSNGKIVIINKTSRYTYLAQPAFFLKILFSIFTTQWTIKRIKSSPELFFLIFKILNHPAFIRLRTIEVVTLCKFVTPCVFHVSIMRIFQPPTNYLQISPILCDDKKWLIGNVRRSRLLPMCQGLMHFFYYYYSLLHSCVITR